MWRIQIKLNEQEHSALIELALSESRDTRRQTTWLIREALIAHGLLPERTNVTAAISSPMPAPKTEAIEQ